MTERLAYWAVGQTIKIRDVATGKEIHSLPGPAGNGLEPGLEPRWQAPGVWRG